MKSNNPPIVFIRVLIIILITSVYIPVTIVHAQSMQIWSDPVNLSNSGAASDPLFVIDSAGVFHVIWVDEIDGYKYVQSEDGTTWTSPITVDFPFTVDDDLPKFVADSNGTIHAVWRNDEDVLYYSETDAENFGDSGAWSIRAALAESALDFYITLDSKETLHLGYVRNISTENDQAGIYYRRSPVGSGWSPSQNLYSSEYYRSLEPENTHIRLTTVSGEIDDEVYMVWDDRPQKRIFIATSMDGGQTWSESEQVKGPEELTGYQTPLNGEIFSFGDTVLFLWQVGDTNNQCVQYSQSSFNEGNDWGEPIKILDENLGCPNKTELYSLEQNLSLLLLDIQGRLSLIAWNGYEWSNPQLQSGLLEIFNPTTFDAVNIGCSQISLHNNVINLVGCDQGSSDDIWFTSRLMGSVENWYPNTFSWSPIELIADTEQMISSLTSIAYLDSVHLLWVQSARSDLDEYTPYINYSKWDDESWSNPRPIISNLTGKPLQISVTHDSEGRLLLIWVDEKDGNLYFSWAVSEVADRSSEWIQPVIVPSISQLNSSPDMLVDASGKIFVAYAINMNEGRGIYIVQSSDLGDSWTSPLLAFDAVSVGWEMIDDPKISLSEDGRIHLLFHRYSVRNDEQSMGMYYMQSTDGGITWSEPELVKTGLIAWSEIYSYDQQVVHRFWQEKNGLEISYIDQLSFDMGITWESPIKIIGANEESTQVSLAMDQIGILRLAQLTYGEELRVQDWEWDGTRWILQESKELALRGDRARYSIENNVTSNGTLVVSILLENSDSDGNKTDEIWSLYQSLDITEKTQNPILPIVPTTNPILTTNESPNTTPTSIGDIFPPANLNDSPPENRKDLVGWFLVVAILILTVVIIRPKRKR